MPWLACQSILDSVRTGVICSPVFDNSPLDHNALDLDALVMSRCGGCYQPSARNLIYRYRAQLYWHDVLAKVTVISLTAEDDQSSARELIDMHCHRSASAAGSGSVLVHIIVFSSR